MKDGQKLFMSQKDFDHIAKTPLKTYGGENRGLRGIMDESVTSATFAIRKSTNCYRDPLLRFEWEYLGKRAGLNFLKNFDAYLETVWPKARLAPIGVIRRFTIRLRTF